MSAKKFNQGYLIVTGLILISAGFILIFKQSLVMLFIDSVLPIIIWIDAISHLIRFIQQKDGKTWLFFALSESLFAILFYFSSWPFSLIATFFGFYIGVKGFALLMKFKNYYRNHLAHWFALLLNGVGTITLAGALLFSIIIPVKNSLNLLGIYLVFCGLFNEYWSIEFFSLDASLDKIKRRIRITPPIIIDVLLPRKTLNQTNRLLKPRALNKEHQIPVIVQNKQIEKPILEVFIHVTKKGFGSIGHVDLCFKGEVISYGNYDEDSVHFFNMLGAGVLITGAPKTEYLAFCIENNQKTIFCFGLNINKAQARGVEQHIAKIKQNCYPWSSHYQKEGKECKDYASQLTQAMDCQLYKFHTGVFKTYFVLTTNCVLLADTILGPTGIDLLTMNGILTPGTYLEFLKEEFNKKESVVVSYDVFD